MPTGSLPVSATPQHNIIELYDSPGLCGLLAEIRKLANRPLAALDLHLCFLPFFIIYGGFA
jgi:hypothetical protein